MQLFQHYSAMVVFWLFKLQQKVDQTDDIA